MIDDNGVERLLASATKGFLSCLEDSPTRRIRCSPKTVAEADIVGLDSKAGNGILSRATSEKYEPEVAIENGDFITIVYKRRVSTDGRDSDGFSEEKSQQEVSTVDETGGVLLSVSQVDSREVMPPPPPPPAVKMGFSSSFSLPSPLRTSTPIQSPAKKRKLTSNTSQSSKNSELDSTLDYLDYTGLKNRKPAFSSSNMSFSSSTARRRYDRDCLEDKENRVILNLPNSSFASSNKSDKSPRVVYSKREIEAIYQGVSVYGDRDWKSILLAHLTTFHQSRTPVKLYDKWRQQLSRYPDAKTYFERKVKKDFMTSRHHHTYW